VLKAAFSDNTAVVKIPDIEKATLLNRYSDRWKALR
jgi:hypothetical protein